MFSQAIQTECQPALASNADSMVLLINEVLTDFIQTRDDNIAKNLTLDDEVLSKWVSTKAQLEEANKLDSCFFNPLRSIPIYETTHSAILGDLLNPHGSHGQGNLFLQPFLNFLNVPDPAKGKWTVTVEKGRIDILLRRILPKCVIIIENKSNFADDQPNQLYRYWEQEIYRQNPNLNYESDDIKRLYQIVYLPPDISKKLDDNSLKRPSDWSTTMPERIPIDPKLITFQELMQLWLAETAIKLDATINSRLTAFLRFYSDRVHFSGPVHELVLGHG